MLIKVSSKCCSSSTGVHISISVRFNIDLNQASIIVLLKKSKVPHFTIA